MPAPARSARARRTGRRASFDNGSCHGPSRTRPRTSIDPDVEWTGAPHATASPSTVVPSGKCMHSRSEASSYSALTLTGHGVSELRSRWPSASTRKKRRFASTPFGPSCTSSGCERRKPLTGEVEDARDPRHRGPIATMSSGDSCVSSSRDTSSS